MHESLLVAARAISAGVAAANAADVDAKARFPSETIAALKEARLLSAPIPLEFGGGGCSMRELTSFCSVLAQSCASSAMVLAMHYIQVGCIVRHGMHSEYFRQYMRDLSRNQYLLASMTSEAGVFGDTRSSICALEQHGATFTLNKDATTGSYCAQGDGILVTCRANADAAAGDQLLVLVLKQDYTLTQTSTWDPMGMRGTSSPGFKLESTGRMEQVLPGSYADSSAQTMVPYSHILWASLWWGNASGAVQRAAAFVRGQARQTPGQVPPTARRLAEVTAKLHAMRNNWMMVAHEFDAVPDTPDGRETLSTMSWALRFNNLKVSCSEAAPEIIHRALQIVGILGYKNDSPYSMGRAYRDSLSASLMVSNERIAGKSANILLILKED